MRRILVLLALLTSTLYAQPATVAERYLLSAINAERAAASLQPLQYDAALTRAALLHAEEMARHGRISHQFAGEPELAGRGFNAGVHFARIAENVAEGHSVVILHDAWMRSPGHRENILDSAVDAVGIAVVALAGQLYAVEDFARIVPPYTLEQQEATVALLLDQAGILLIPSPAARRTCAMETGYAGDDRPAFVVRYTTADLNQLPSALSKILREHREHRASVGACLSTDHSAFSQYNLAIVLFP